MDLDTEPEARSTAIKSCSECRGEFLADSEMQSIIILPPRIADHLQLQQDTASDVIELSEGRGQCKLCGTVLKTMVAARSHVKKIHLSGSIECTICGNQSKNKQAFAMHLLRRHQLRGVQQATAAYGKVLPPDAGPPLEVGLEFEPKVELI